MSQSFFAGWFAQKQVSCLSIADLETVNAKGGAFVRRPIVHFFAVTDSIPLCYASTSTDHHGRAGPLQSFVPPGYAAWVQSHD